MSDTSTQPLPAAHQSGPVPDRRVKVGHLVVGLVFLGLAGSWALNAAGALSGVGGAVVVPLVLVAAGLLGLMAMVVGGIRRRVRPTGTTPGEQAAVDVHRAADADDEPATSWLEESEPDLEPDLEPEPVAEPVTDPVTDETAPLALRKPDDDPDRSTDQRNTDTDTEEHR